MNSRATILMLLLSIISGCRETPEPPRLPTTSMQIGNRTFLIEIAANDPDRTKGLMDRESLPPDRGMIFVFSREEPRSFWMKNVTFPLDIIFLDAGGKVVDVKRMLPLDLRSVPSARPAKYAIEVNAGVAAEVGLKIGDTIAIPGPAREPPEGR